MRTETLLTAKQMTVRLSEYILQKKMVNVVEKARPALCTCLEAHLHMFHWWMAQCHCFGLSEKELRIKLSKGSLNVAMCKVLLNSKLA